MSKRIGFREHESGHGWMCVDPTYEDALLALGLPDPEAFARLGAEASGADGRGATAVHELPGREDRLHWRPCRHGGLLGRWLGDRWLGRERAVAELEVTLRLLRTGAPVPRPLLVAGWRRGPFWQLALGTRHLEGARDGVEVLESSNAGTLPALAAAAGRAVRRFHDAGGLHADLHLKNLMLDADGASVWILDLDRARSDGPPSPARRMHEIGRLTRSLLKRGVHARVGRRGREAFFGAYVEGDAKLARAMLASWPKEQRSIARHARGYTNPG
jgi:3-deoxy-D-manno-octulosonic acid kinase